MTVLNIYCEVCKTTISHEKWFDLNLFHNFLFLNILNMTILYPPPVPFFKLSAACRDTILSLVPLTRMLLPEILVCVSVEKSPESARGV